MYSMNSDELNTIAWNKEVKRNNYWTRPVTKEAIEEARKGNLTLPFLVDKPMRKDSIDQLGNEVLLVGAGGGQQAPLLSAYGKKVTLVDISEMQLKQDEFVKKRDNLTFDIIQGSMSERLNFNANSFDSVVNPVSINFIKNPKYFYEEVKRVLKPNGIFITAFANPALYMFSPKALEKGKMKIKYTLPFDADISLSDKKRKKMISQMDTFEYSHLLQTLIGNLIDLGFSITGFDTAESDFEPIDSFLKECYIAIKANKL